MKTYMVTATVVDEICIADRHDAGNEYIGRDYIPGTAWWGAMAAGTGIKRGEEPKEQFRNIFYSNEIIFTNLYPKKTVRAHPIPLSARTRKSAPGFKSGQEEMLFCDGNGDLYPGGVKDLLLDAPQRYEPDWEPISGWYEGDPPTCRPTSTQMVMRGHNDRAGRSGTTSEGKLFTRQNIRRSEKFEGALYAITATGEENLEEFLKSYLDNSPFEIPVGRQPGYVAIELEEEGNKPPYWQRHNLLNNDETQSTITVTLLSDAILVDRWLRSLTYLPAESVAASVKVPVDAVELNNHYSALKNVLGWNNAYMRPRESELAVIAGSAFCYLIKWPQKITSEEKLARLAEWQQQGIGLRTAEGFGEIRINDPFHQVFNFLGGESNGGK